MRCEIYFYNSYGNRTSDEWVDFRTETIGINN